MSRRVTVHHFVANLTTRQYGLHPTSDLLGVDYVHDVPADAEFPRTLTRMDLFTRFYLKDAPPTSFSVRVWWADDPRGTGATLVGKYGPYTVTFPPGSLVYDHVFRVTNIRLAGVGRYAVQLIRRRKAGWKAGEVAIYAETHFRVER